jgi:hypothetical protein
MAKTLPQFDNLVQGLGYADAPAPDGDAADTEGWGSSTIPNLPQGQPSPLQPVSIATTSRDAPNLSQTWSSGDKGTNWMGNPSYPTSSTGKEGIE